VLIYSNITAWIVAIIAHTWTIDHLVSILVLLNLEPIGDGLRARVAKNTTSCDKLL